jgi:sn-glycerol 3-phosphate transport system ATP-binding protein/multiple sugar transport system ATP-binding protein
MGRAIARRPSLFLFDEPLSNLDAALRTEVRVEIKRLHARLGATMVYVTHDQVEAMTLASQLIVLRGGGVEQSGPPLEVYDRPRTRFVASFLGSPAMNFFAAVADGGRLKCAGLELACPRAAHGPVTAGIRPHDVVVRSGGGLRLVVDVVESMGFESLAYGRVGETPFVARLAADHACATGDVVELGVADGKVHLFDPGTERSLP